jgi:hypothetical protein
MSEATVDATEYVPVDRWRRLGRIDAIRKRVRRIAIGAGIVFFGLTVAPSGGDLSLLLGVIRLVSLVTGISAWSVSEALGTATEDEDEDEDGSILAAVGIIVLAVLAWSAERSGAGSLLWRLLLGEAVSAATGSDASGTAITDADPTAGATATRNVDAESQPAGAYLGPFVVFLVGAAVILLSLPRTGRIGPGGLGVFLLLTVVVGSVVGLLAGLSIR